MNEEQLFGRPYCCVLSVLFILVLWLPIFDCMFGLDPSPISGQRLANAPELRWQLEALRKLPWATRAYVKERFGFRASMLRLHGMVKTRILNVSPHRSVRLGVDGWLFLGLQVNRDTYRRVNPLTEEELAEWARHLEDRKDFLAGLGSRFLVLIVPEKETVYSEFVIDDAEPLGGPSRREQLVKYLQNNTSVEVLDLTSALSQARLTERVYHRTDSHWNAAGGVAAAIALGQKLQVEFPGVLVDERRDFTAGRRLSPGGDLARMMGLKYDLREQQVLCFRREPLPHAIGRELEVFDIGGGEDISTQFPDAPIRRAVIFRDSFASQLIPFAWQYFEEADWLWTYEFDTETIRARKPDVVIQEFAERKLMEWQPGLDRAVPIP